MSDDDPRDPGAPAPGADVFQGLPPEQLLSVVVHRLRHLEEAVATLRGLVPKAFAEGFRRRLPDAEEPWLADWLVSDAKAELEAVVPRKQA